MVPGSTSQASEKMSFNTDPYNFFFPPRDPQSISQIAFWDFSNSPSHCFNSPQHLQASVPPAMQLKDLTWNKASFSVFAEVAWLQSINLTSFSPCSRSERKTNLKYTDCWDEMWHNQACLTLLLVTIKHSISKSSEGNQLFHRTYASSNGNKYMFKHMWLRVYPQCCVDSKFQMSLSTDLGQEWDFCNRSDLQARKADITNHFNHSSKSVSVDIVRALRSLSQGIDVTKWLTHREWLQMVTTLKRAETLDSQD